MGAAKKALPRLGQTQDVMKAFVETGKTEPVKSPTYEPTQEPMHKPMHTPMNMHASISGEAMLCESVQRKRQEGQERIVQRGYAMPESLANRMRVIAAAEQMTCTEIVVEAVSAWVAEYSRRFSK